STSPKHTETKFTVAGLNVLVRRMATAAIPPGARLIEFGTAPGLMSICTARKTLTSAEAELFAVSGSLVVAVTDALLWNDPGCEGTTVTVAVTLPPTGTVPMAQENAFGGVTVHD